MMIRMLHHNLLLMITHHLAVRVLQLAGLHGGTGRRMQVKRVKLLLVRRVLTVSHHVVLRVDATVIHVRRGQLVPRMNQVIIVTAIATAQIV